MRKVRLWVDTGFYNIYHEEIIEIEDDWTEEDLDLVARDYMFENIQYGWEEID